MKNVPVKRLQYLAEKFGTPLWVYDAQTIRDRINDLRQFDTIRFAQKACSNINILKLMREQGVQVDAVSREKSLEHWPRVIHAWATKKPSFSLQTLSMKRRWPP